MKLIFTSYSGSPTYTDPGQWLQRISGYTGILESLSETNKVIGIERINYEGQKEQNGVHYYFHRQQKKQIHFPWRMHRRIKKLKPEVVFINGFIFPLQIIQLRLTLGRNVKIIILHRAEKPFNNVKKYLQKIADGCVNAYLFTSTDFGKEWMAKNIISDPKKIYEVIQGSSRFLPQNRIRAKEVLAIEGSPIFLCVGRLNANKDPLTVVKGFIRFLSVQPSAKLYMIYQTEELLNEIKKLIAGSDKAKEAIVFIGKVPQEQLQTWYSAADFIISGSHYEGSGIAVCEAMSCACIPIATKIPSFIKMTDEGRCGFLYDTGNEEQLFAVLSKTKGIDMEGERRKVLDRFNKEFSFHAISEKINNIIASL
jgi:glycosyltransferase involved in cell wall biosynthesis